MSDFHKTQKNSIDILRAVATDGHRLAQYDIPLPQGAEDMTGLIIPKKTILELRRVLDDAKDDLNKLKQAAILYKVIKGGICSEPSGTVFDICAFFVVFRLRFVCKKL